jgi:hypothetical protein
VLPLACAQLCVLYDARHLHVRRSRL